MDQSKTLKARAIFGLLAAIQTLLFISSSFATNSSGAKRTDSIDIPCGILENFSGDVRIMDSERRPIADAKLRSSISCGAWISVNYGWAQIRHQVGPSVHLGARTFVQFPDPKLGDQMLLYRGQAYVQVRAGQDEFKVVSATGRARMKRDQAIIIFNPEENETQLIALENSATLENRFEPGHKVQVQAGESTELNLKLLRVIPTLPSAVSISSLRPKLAQLRVLERDQLEALRAAKHRRGRRFASVLVSDIDEGSSGTVASKSGRKIAGVQTTGTYMRHVPDPIDTELRTRWVNKMVGGDHLEKMGEKILYPDKDYGTEQKIQIEVDDPTDTPGQKRGLKDSGDSASQEKKKLIDELSKIRVE